MYQLGCCLSDKGLGSGMHFEHHKVIFRKWSTNQKATGPSPHHAFPECHLLSLFLLAYGCTNLGRCLLKRMFKEKSAIKVITVK